MSRADNSRPLSPIDTAWYHLDRQGRMLDIGALLFFDEPFSLSDLRALVEERLLSRPRFRELVVDSPLGRPHWAPDPHFRLDAHLHHLQVPRPGDDQMLARTVGDLMSSPLDLGRPLWELYLLERSQNRSAILARIHHCFGDGFSLGHLLLSLGIPEGEPWQGNSENHNEDNQDHHEGWLHHLRDLATHPDQALDAGRQAARAARALARLVLLPFDTQTVLHRPLSHVRRAAWSDVIPLSTIKEIGKSRDATINDVVLTALTGALRAHLLEAGEPVGEVKLRAVVPVNLRAASFLEEMSDELGNHFGLVFANLPIESADPSERLLRMKAEIDRLKATPEAVISFGILQALGHTPAFFEHLVEELFIRKASLVASNVPGPRQPLFFAGRRLKDVLFWNPHPGRLGLGMSIMSYAGRVRIGIRADAEVIPDPGRLADYFHRELRRMESSR